MGPKEADAERDDLLLLDVREQWEWDAGHVAGSIHVPMSQLPARLAEIPDDRRILAICRSGNRSDRVTAWLSAQGRQAVNLDGGLKAWALEGLPLETTGGQPGQVV